MILTSEGLSVDLNGEALRLEDFYISGYGIKAHLGAADGLSGKRLHKMAFGERDIKIEGYIASNLEENRRLLAKICTQDKPFYIIDGDYRLEAVAKRGLEISCQKRFLNKLLKFTVYAKSVSPLWQGTSEQVEEFYSIGGVSNQDKNIKITNSGDAPTGFLLEVSMRTSADKLMITKNGEYIDLVRHFAIGDKVLIDTRRGKKGVTLIPSDGTGETGIMDSLAMGSTFFELDAGENTLGFSVITGLTNMTFTFSPCYLR